LSSVRGVSAALSGTGRDVITEVVDSPAFHATPTPIPPPRDTRVNVSTF
jgi:hypothetical protein